MDALRRIHAALVPGGVVVDTQPVSEAPPVEGEARALGSLDLREWVGVVGSVDERVGTVLDEGLFEIVDERRFVVTDAYADGPELVADARNWVGTRVDEALGVRLTAVDSPVRLHQEVRLRVLIAR